MYMFPILENLANTIMLYVWGGLMVIVHHLTLDLEISV